MSLQYPESPQMQVLYSADPYAIHHMRFIRDRVRHICSSYVNRVVRVETIDGRIYEGTIVSSDEGHLYISVPYPSGFRPLFPFYYNNVILPLVLYDLLVITLLYT